MNLITRTFIKPERAEHFFDPEEDTFSIYLSYLYEKQIDMSITYHINPDQSTTMYIIEVTPDDVDRFDIIAQLNCHFWQTWRIMYTSKWEKIEKA